jgi:hypothetical protein
VRHRRNVDDWPLKGCGAVRRNPYRSYQSDPHRLLEKSRPLLRPSQFARFLFSRPRFHPGQPRRVLTQPVVPSRTVLDTQNISGADAETNRHHFHCYSKVLAAPSQIRCSTANWHQFAVVALVCRFLRGPRLSRVGSNSKALLYPAYGSTLTAWSKSASFAASASSSKPIWIR